MKVTKTQLKQIIKEELNTALNEEYPTPAPEQLLGDIHVRLKGWLDKLDDHEEKAYEAQQRGEKYHTPSRFLNGLSKELEAYWRASFPYKDLGEKR